jgi:hypothetical protein
MKRRSSFLTIAASLAWWLAGPGVPLRAADNATPEALSVTISAVQPDAGDAKLIAWEKQKKGQAQTAPAPVYVVKIYCEMPSPGARAYRLYIGDEQIREYGSFPAGIFLKVYDADVLRKWAGKPLKMGVNRAQAVDMGRAFPPDQEVGAATQAGVQGWERIQDVLSR